MVPVAPHLREPLRAALRGERAAWPALSEDDVDTLVEHGVAPLVYAVAGVPELRVAAMRAAAVEPLRQSDLTLVLTALGDRGVPVLVMKGSALAFDLYDAPELRPRSDTDLLIPHHALGALRDTLTAHGFGEQRTSGDEHGLRQTTFLRTDAYGIEHAYDVHWDVTNKPAFTALLRFEDVARRSVALPALGPHARGFDRSDALMMACIHRVAHHHDSERLIWLVDIAMLRRRMTAEEHRSFWRAAADGRVVAVCRRSIALAAEWCGGDAGSDGAETWLTREELERDEPSSAFLDREMTYGNVLLADLRALSWRVRLQRLRQLAFPPAAFMRESFGTSRNTSLPLLYVYRGVRGIRRLFARVGTR